MPNISVPAAAPGLPKINRRSALLGIAAPLASLPVASRLSEDLEVVRAGAQIAAAAEVLTAAMARKQAARALFEHMSPALPKMLHATRIDRHLGLAEDERDIEGARIFPPHGSACRMPRGVIRSDLLQLAVDGFGKESPEGIYAARKLPAALRYERRIEKARASSQIDDAMEAEFVAGRNLEKLALAIAAMPIRTLDGLRIKALALSAYGSIGHSELHRGAVLIGPTLAEDALAIIQPRVG